MSRPMTVFIALLVLAGGQVMSALPVFAHASFSGNNTAVPVNTDRTFTLRVPIEPSEFSPAPDVSNFYNNKVVMEVPSGWQITNCASKTGWSCAIGSSVTWTNNSGATNGFEDDNFVFTAKTGPTPGPAYFRTFQTYNTGCSPSPCASHWDIPEDSQHPAPKVVLVGAATTTTAPPAPTTTSTRPATTPTTSPSSSPSASSSPSPSVPSASSSPSAGASPSPSSGASPSPSSSPSSGPSPSAGPSPGAGSDSAVALGSLVANSQGSVAGIATVPAGTAPGEYEVTATGPGASNSGTLTASPGQVAPGGTLSLSATDFAPSAEVVLTMVPAAGDQARASGGFRIAQTTRTVTARVQVVAGAGGSSSLSSENSSTGNPAPVDQALASTDSAAVWMQMFGGIAALGLAWRIRRSKRA